MTQVQIERFDQEEYTNLLAYGEPRSSDHLLHLSTNGSMGIDEEQCLTLDWIGTLDSTTYPGLTFGYHAQMGS